MTESEGGGGVVWKGMKMENGLRYASGPVQYKNHPLRTCSDPFVYTWSRLMRLDRIYTSTP